MTRWLPLVLFPLLALAWCLPVTAQEGEDPDNPFGLPPDYMQFWRRYQEAVFTDDDGEVDEVVRKMKEPAEHVLDILLDGLARGEEYERQSASRELAWSLDRVNRSTNFIERVRFVIDLEMSDRRRRAAAMARWDKALRAWDDARDEDSEVAYSEASGLFREAVEDFAAVGDHEFQVYCYGNMASIAQKRGRVAERAVFLEQLVEAGQHLPYESELVRSAEGELEALVASGIDTEEVQAVAEQAAKGLEAFAEGSSFSSAELTRVTPKKGITGVNLPSFYPPDQFLLWPETWVDREKDSNPFDTQRGIVLQPHPFRWNLRLIGMSQFELDSDGDGEADVEFSPSNTPALIEIPGPDGDLYPLQVATRADRELAFGIETNYAPAAPGARLRFWLGSHWEAKVLGQPWVLYDTNLTGQLGDPMEFFGDSVSYYDEANETYYQEFDSVIVGKAKKAVPLSSIMHLDDGFYRTEVEFAAKQIRVRQLDLPTGFVKLELGMKVQPTHVVAAEMGVLEGALFDLLPARKGKAVELPVGRYRLVLGRMEKGKRTSLDQVRIYGAESDVFRVDAGETTVLELGPPYRLTFEHSVQEGDSGPEVVVDTRTIRIFGKSGEEYAMLFDDPLQPDVAVREAGAERPLAKPETMRRTGIEEWQLNTGPDNVLWFPAEYRFPVSGDTSYEVQLTQKSHAMLGGPLESDWIP